MTPEPLLNIYAFNNNNLDLFSTFSFFFAVNSNPKAEMLQNYLLQKYDPLLYLTAQQLHSKQQLS